MLLFSCIPDDTWCTACCFSNQKRNLGLRHAEMFELFSVFSCAILILPLFSLWDYNDLCSEYVTFIWWMKNWACFVFLVCILLQMYFVPVWFGAIKFKNFWQALEWFMMMTLDLFVSLFMPNVWCIVLSHAPATRAKHNWQIMMLVQLVMTDFGILQACKWSLLHQLLPIKKMKALL